MRAIGNGIGIPFRRNTGQGVIWPPDLKSALVCWYSPRKQKLTEYDVIESYAEDFLSNKWVNTENVNAATITSKTITYNRNVGDRNRILSTNKPCESFIIYATVSTYAWRYQYVDEGGVTQFYDIKNGINILPKSYNNGSVTIGFLWMGNNIETSISIVQLPTSILKDFSGNGLNAYMYGFQGKLNSGMGVYKFDFLSDLRINSAYLPYTERQDDKICSLAGHPAGWLFQFTSLSDIPAFKVEVKGIVNDKFTYRWYDENGNRGVDIAINEDGIYELPMSYSVETNNGVGISCNVPYQDNVCFTQLPDYPNQLCYSGKEYCISFNQPILTDYTVIADRTWFEIGSNSCFASKRLVRDGFDNIAGAFAIEYRQKYCNNFGAATAISFEANKQEVIVQTKAKYMSTNINVGDGDDSDILIIGANNNRADAPREPYKGCHSDFLLFNRTLSEDEINWLKDNWEKI